MIPARSPSHVGAVVVLFRPDHTEAPCAPGRVLRVVEDSDLVAVVFDEFAGGRVLAGQLCSRVRHIQRPASSNEAAWQQLRDEIARTNMPVCWSESDEFCASASGVEKGPDDAQVIVGDELCDHAHGVPPGTTAALNDTDPTDVGAFDVFGTIASLQQVLAANPYGSDAERAAAIANVVRTFPPTIRESFRRFVQTLAAALPQVDA